MTLRQIVAFDTEIRILKARREAAIIAMQDACQHPIDSVLEADYEPTGWIAHAKAPFRVCKLCGYAEEGWGCGYQDLKTTAAVPRISRDTANRDYVLKFYSQHALTNRRAGSNTKGIG